MKERLFVGYLIVLLNQYCVAAQSETYTLKGNVIDYYGKPFSGAKVICYQYDSNLLNVSSKSFDIAYTSSDGKYSFEVRKVRNISLIVAYKSGLALGWAGMNIQSELSPTIILGEPTFLKGMVVDEKGNPIENADVRMLLRNEMMSRPEDIEFDLPDPENWYSRKTDSQGQFLFNNVPKGSYAIFQVRASGKASICVERDSKSNTEYFAAGRDDIRIVLPKEAVIKGQVIDEITGQNLAGIQVKAEFYKKDSFLYREKLVRTDSNGIFEFSQLESHKYQLSVKNDKKGYGYVNVDAESGQTIDDVKITFKKGLPFEVKVYDPVNETGIKDACVIVSQRDTESGHDIFTQKMITDANGIARLNVIPGESNLEVTKLDYGSTITDRYDLKINTKNENKIEVALPHSAYFYSGNAVDEQGNSLDSAEIISDGFGPYALTDANGCFDTRSEHIFSPSFPSSTKIFARHEPTGLASFTQLNDPNRTGKLEGKVVLRPAYTIKGKINDTTGKPIPAAYVKLIAGERCTLITQTITDVNGEYCIRSVPLSENSMQYFIIAYGQGYSEVVSDRISFTDDAAKPVDMNPIELKPADKVISGIVRDANEKPVSNAIVSFSGPGFFSNYQRLSYPWLLTDEQGKFYFKGVFEEPLTISGKRSIEQQEYGITYAHGGDMDIRIVLGQTLNYAKTLIGKKLPVLKDFGIELNQDDNKVLLCFFDIEQRPSRSCILELNKRIQGLSEKKITVFSVHASKVEQSVLNDWIKENNVSISVGMIQENEEKTRKDWGVQSLPWLILTDDAHIVITEGFSINEIDEKINQIR